MPLNIGTDSSRVQPHADVAFRFGMGDHFDFTARAGTSGTEAGLKRSFEFTSVPQIKLAAEGRLSMWVPAYENRLPLLGATVGGIAQWSPHGRLHLLFAPRVSAVSLPMGPDQFPGGNLEDHGSRPGLQSHNVNVLFLPTASIGIGFDVLPTARVIAEANTMLHPALLSSGVAGLPPISGGLALQWRVDQPSQR